LNSNIYLRYYPDPALRVKCTQCHLSSDQCKEVGEEMIQIMYDNDGYGLSASQVGLDFSLFVMRVPEMRERSTSLSILSERKGLIFVNPKIVGMGEKRKTIAPEGCLSLPGVPHIKIERFAEIEFEYNDPYHEVGRINLLVKGLDARCVQHEIDHLNGIMIFDHINSNLSQKLYLEKYAKHRKLASRRH
jgi:peptide deformylase